MTNLATDATGKRATYRVGSRDLPAHPAANVLPLIVGEEFTELVDDIRANGLHEPVWIYDDPDLGVVLLDGRNRAAACLEAGVPVTTRRYAGTDPIGFAESEGLRTRHLNSGQIAFARLAYNELREVTAAAERKAASARERNRRQARAAAPEQSTIDCPEVAPGPPPDELEIKDSGKVRDRIAGKGSGTSGRSVGRAIRVRKEAPELVAKVREGTITLKEAEREVRQRAKAAKVAQIAAEPVAPVPKDRTYHVLYVDPPWRYDHVEADGRKIENHYPTMSAAELAAMHVPAHDDAVMFMWATSPKLAEALALMAAWNFDYRTCAVWVKDKIGMGYYFRQRHELLLVGKRGALPVPGETDRPDSVIEAPRLQHSAKPPDVYALIERMYPSYPRLELFAREARTGWDAWGNQA